MHNAIISALGNA